MSRGTAIVAMRMRHGIALLVKDYSTILRKGEYKMKDSIKVAGVTFSNPDGENRQDILKTLGLGWKTARLKQTTFENERAVEIRVSGKLIGYVPKNQLTNPLSYETELTVFIGICKHKYYAIAMPRETPSGAEYALMKKLCMKAKIAMPAYDKRAYAQYWAVVKA